MEKEIINNTKDRINVRCKSLKLGKLAERNQHDFRKYKNISERDNIDISRIKDNVYFRSEKKELELLESYQEQFRFFYKKKYKRNPELNKVSPFNEMVLTFPHKYQDKPYTKNEWNNCLLDFRDKFEAETGLKILNIVEHNDETTRHYHIKTSSYSINQDKEIITNVAKRKGFKSRLQDIAGDAFTPIGLRRGNKKEHTKAYNQTPRQFYETENKKIREHTEILDKALEDNILDIEELDQLIEKSENPYKKLYRQVKRIKKYSEELEETVSATHKTINNILKAFPKLKKYQEDNIDMPPLKLLELLTSKLAGSSQVSKIENEIISTLKK